MSRPVSSGVVITYGYTNGKVTSVTSGSETILSGVLYDPFGPIRGWTWGNASQMVRTYDLDGNLDQLDSGGLKTYAQDDAFRITGITDTVDASKSWNYGYDLLDRLTAATRTGLTQGWSYDANGNRLSQTGSSPSTYTMAGTSNRLNGVSGALSRSYGYDAAGNATADGTASFGYDGAGRMTSASKSGVSASYAQNALGQRVKKTVNGATTIMSYDESGHLLGEYEISGALIREYVWLGDIPVAVITGGPGTPPYVFWYVHTDHLNTPRAVENPTNGELVWRWDSAPFGETVPNEDPDGDFNPFVLPLRFPGQYADAETGLHYNYFRDYDPAIGRYVQSDPIGLNGGIDTYVYIDGSPTSGTDSFGLIDLKIPGTSGETTVHANPGPEAIPHPGPGSRVEHLPPHIHLGDNNGPRVRTDNWEPYSPTDARRLTDKQKKFCKQLSAKLKALIRSRQADVFKYGKMMAILAALPAVDLDSLTAACKQDPFWCAENMPHVFDDLMDKYCTDGECKQ